MALFGWSWRGWCSLLGACLITKSGGAINSFGNIAPYIVSYMRQRGHDKHLTYQVVISCSGVLFATTAVGTGIGTWTEKHYGLRKSVILGSLLGWIGMLSSFWSIRVSYILFIFTYGVMYGLSSGLSTTPPLIAIMKLFPQNRGMVAGIIQGCGGLGGVIFSLTKTLYINPGNLKPNDMKFEGERAEIYYTQDSVLDRTPSSFLLQAGICAILQLVGLLLYYDLAEEKGDTKMQSILDRNHEYSEDSADEKSSSNINTSAIDEEEELGNPDSNSGGTVSRDPRMSGLSLDLYQMIKYASLWQFIAMNAACIFSGVAVMGSYKTFGIDFIDDDLFLSAIGSTASILNFCGNAIFGLAIDHFSIKVTSTVLCGMLSSLILILPVTSFQGRLLFSLVVCGVFFTVGGAVTIQPVFAMRAYGEEHFVGNANFILLMVSFVPNILGTFASFIQHFLSWETMYVCLGVIPGLAMFAGMFMKLKNRQNQYV